MKNLKISENIKNQKYKITQKVLAVLLATASTFSFAGCTSTVECDVNVPHAHNYVNDEGLDKYIISENKFCYTELFIDIDNKVVDNADYNTYELSIGYNKFINDFYLAEEDYIEGDDVPTYLINHERIHYYDGTEYVYENKEIGYGCIDNSYNRVVYDKIYNNDHINLSIMEEMLALEGIGIEF